MYRLLITIFTMKPKQLCILLFHTLFILSAVSGAEYKVCFGSFIIKENALSLEDRLYGIGIDTEQEKIIVQGKLFTRVLDALSFSSYKEAKNRLDRLNRDSSFRALGLRNLWIRKDTSVKQDDAESDNYSAVEKTDSDKTDYYKEENQSDNTDSGKTNDTVIDTTDSVDDSDWITPELEWASAGGYKKKHKDGYFNMLFATSEIPLGQESTLSYKTRFTYPEKVFARCYFPSALGEVGTKDFWHEIWIDGKMKMRTYFSSAINPGLDQIQIWITEDEYKSQMEELGPGEHKIVIWVIKNEYRGEKAVAETGADGSVESEMKEIWVPLRLSKGSFTYVVK